MVVQQVYCLSVNGDPPKKGGAAHTTGTRKEFSRQLQQQRQRERAAERYTTQPVESYAKEEKRIFYGRVGSKLLELFDNAGNPGGVFDGARRCRYCFRLLLSSEVSPTRLHHGEWVQHFSWLIS